MHVRWSGQNTRSFEDIRWSVTSIVRTHRLVQHVKQHVSFRNQILGLIADILGDRDRKFM